MDTEIIGHENIDSFELVQDKKFWSCTSWFYERLYNYQLHKMTVAHGLKKTPFLAVH
jgi:hypothetical protein